MKKFFLLFVLSIVTVSGWARTNSENVNNPKYGAGAVPVVNGKVVFDYNIQTEKDENTVFRLATDWAKRRFGKPTVLNRYFKQNDIEEKIFSLSSSETMVFKSSAFVTDYTRISYTTTITVKDSVCNVSFTDIVYSYNENRPEVEATEYRAEDWITDKEAMNKAKTKFLKKTGKFRVTTIQLFNNLSQELQAALEQ